MPLGALHFRFMLNLNLSEVAREEVQVRGEIPADDPVWNDTELTLIEPLRVEGTARSVGEGALVRGQIRTKLSIPCRRCLVSMETDIDETVDLLFEPLDPEEEEELEGEVYPLPGRGDVLDLTEPLREQLLLVAPRFVVCTEECRGLCPQCGANRNETTCECVPEKGESPWEALKNITFD